MTVLLCWFKYTDVGYWFGSQVLVTKSFTLQVIWKILKILFKTFNNYYGGLIYRGLEYCWNIKLSSKLNITQPNLAYPILTVYCIFLFQECYSPLNITFWCNKMFAPLFVLREITQTKPSLFVDIISLTISK